MASTARQIYVIISKNDMTQIDYMTNTQNIHHMIPAIDWEHAKQIIRVWKENYGDNFVYGILEMNI